MSHESPKRLLPWLNPPHPTLALHNQSKGNRAVVPAIAQQENMSQVTTRRLRTANQRAGVRTLAPDVRLFTHFPVGLPSETKEDFEASMAFARDFHYSFFSKFGANTRTLAAR